MGKLGKSSSGSTSVLQPPGSAAAPPPKRRKRSRGNIAAGIVAVIAFLGLLAAPFWLLKVGLSAKHHQDNRNFAQANHTGDVVHDGVVSFRINSIQCGTEAIDKYKSKHGQFCLLDITMRNDGPVPLRFDAISQRAMGSHGGFYMPDPAADAILNKASDTIPDAGDPKHTLETALDPPVAPALTAGQSNTYRIAYDIPLDVRLTQVDLHANEYSPGAQVLFSR
jgi:hypothetical protein